MAQLLFLPGVPVPCGARVDQRRGRGETRRGSICVQTRKSRASPRQHPRASVSKVSPDVAYQQEFQSGVALLENEGAYAVMAAANELEKRTGRDVVHLEIGQPGFPTPDYVCARIAAAIEEGKTKYVTPAGIAALRARIAERTSAQTGVDVSPDEVVVGPGAKPGLFFTTIALVRGPEDEVIIPDPGFPTYEAMVHVAKGTVVPVRMDSFLRCFDMNELERAITPRTRLVVLNSPSNPTGGVATQEDLEKLADLAKQHDFFVISDEIYSQLTYSNDETFAPAPSILSLPGMKERTIVVDGFSKTWSMTGFRLGWAVMPAELAARMELLIVHSLGCTASFVQEAGLAALDGPTDDIAAMRDEYRARRDFVVEELNKIDGVRCRTPEGAFYVFADISDFGMSSRELAELILNEGYVAVLPGTDFGKAGEGFLRLSYVGDMPVLKEGLKRIASVLGNLPLANKR